MDESNETRESRKKNKLKKKSNHCYLFDSFCVKLYLKLKQQTSSNKLNQSTWSWNPQNGCDFYMGLTWLPISNKRFAIYQHLLNPPSRRQKPPIQEWGSHQNSSPKGPEASMQPMHLFFHVLILMYLRGVAQIDQTWMLMLTSGRWFAIMMGMGRCNVSTLRICFLVHDMFFRAVWHFWWVAFGDLSLNFE